MGSNRNSAVSFLTYMVRSLLAVREGRRVGVAGADARPWSELLEGATRDMRRDLRPIVVPLLATLIRSEGGLTEVQRSLVGLSARRLLEFAWGEARRDTGMVRVGIEGVFRTYESALAESEALLRRAIEPAHLAAHGFEEMPIVAREIGRLIPLNPAYVEAVFRAVLAFTDESEASTSVGGESVLMGLRSNRRQDYSMGRHALGEVFPRFMEAAPVEATGVVIAVVEAEVAPYALVPMDQITGEPVRLGDTEARFAEDLSHIWDAGRDRHEIHTRMLDAFEDGLVRLAGPGLRPALLASVLARVAGENRLAALYRRILSAASREPAGLARHMVPLVTSVPVLTSADTAEQAGRFLRRGFGLLSHPEREGVERAILSISTGHPEDEEDYARRRDWLLERLPADQLVSEDAKARMWELAKARAAVPPPFRDDEAEERGNEYDDEGRLSGQEVAGDADRGNGLRELTDRAARFGRDFVNRGPTREETAAAMQTVAELRESLSKGVDGVDERAVAGAWTDFAAASAALARADWLDGAPDVAAFARSALLEAARHELPRPDPEGDARYEEHGLLRPSPRWYAAGGLLQLARFPSLVDGEIIGAIGRLAEDSCTQIRAEVGRNLTALGRTDADAFWQLVRRFASVETSRRVMRFTLIGVRPLARTYREELSPIARAVFARFRDDPDAAEIRSECLRIVVAADSRDGDPFHDEIVQAVVGDPIALPDDAVHLVQVAAENLTVGPVEPSDPQLDRVRRASFALLERIAREVHARARGLEKRLRGVGRADWPPGVPAEIEAIHRVAHELGIRIYFASGSFDEKMGRRGVRREGKSAAVKRRFFEEAAPLLNLLSELALPDVVHHSLETLSAYVAVDPRAVFLAVARAVRHGQSSGYQFESLAADVVVGIIRRYIAEYRYLFREDADCRDALIEVLDIFVRAGWPEAMDLTGRLEEVFR